MGRWYSARMNLLKAVAIACVYASVPIFLGSVGWGFILILEHVPLWVWVVQCVSVVIAALGIASLIDSRSPQQFPPQDDR
jgi:hypothetical protein